MGKNQMQEIPWWNKYSLSLTEASTYYNIDYEVLDQIIREHPKARFIVRSGNNISINKQIFEAFYFKDEKPLPWWEKYSLSIREASIYFNIGENKLRTLLANHPELPFIVRNGGRVTINKKKFEEWYDQISDI